jgi:alkanesulfonate monooxygenase SsuD/methylene tetrahydromethanopterin reductase-like flavin-dependent oxidoreductase (luciferase family)
MPAPLPALALMANPGERLATLDMAREIERRGFAGLSVSSSFGNMSQCLGLAFATKSITFATAIAPIYAQSVDEFAQNAAYIHEVSGGRFQFGIGIAHTPSYARWEAKPGKPLGDTRTFIEKFKAQTQYGPLPPVIVATLRKRMIALSAEIGDGLVFANGSRAYMPDSLSALPAAKWRDPRFFLGNRVRTCISDDIAEAKAALRKSMASYWLLPNYRNYWKETGFADEMATRRKSSRRDAPRRCRIT